MKLKLLETIEKQSELIKKQEETICKLVNENVEQENFINSVMSKEIE